jgi:hypothetical protein
MEINSIRIGEKMSLKPGQNTGRDGGIYREQGPRGGLRDNYSTIPDRTIAPPTSKPNSSWVRVERTPDSKR